VSAGFKETRTVDQVLNEAIRYVRHRPGVGEVMFRRGMRLLPWDLGVLASMGVYRVRVYSLRVAIISTGNELIEVIDVPQEGPPPGRVINSSRFVMEGLVKSLGFDPVYLGIVGDDIDRIAKTVEGAIKDYDAVITTGGISVGRVDYTIKAVMKLNPEYVNHGLSIRPGRPNSIAVINGKPVFMLSGFPVAAATGFDVLVKPILLHMVGGEDEPRPVVKGVLTRRVSTPVNTRSFVRVRVYLGKDGEVYVEPLALTGSGILSTLVRGNGILVVPENREGFDEGDEVEVTLTRPIYREDA
jgi:molybdopterin molybdotransferase